MSDRSDRSRDASVAEDSGTKPTPPPRRPGELLVKAVLGLLAGPTGAPDGHTPPLEALTAVRAKTTNEVRRPTPAVGSERNHRDSTAPSFTVQQPGGAATEGGDLRGVEPR